jgi:arginase family enzyme
VSTTLSHDPLWPRAGGWPDDATYGGPVDLALLGIGTWRTSLSPTGAHATPSAVREALRRFSPALVARSNGESVDLVALTVVDHGDVVEPDGPEGEARARAAVGHALERARVVVAIGGDNALTVPAALGAWGDDLETAGLITLDAHHDLRDGVSNGSPVRRLVEAGLDPRRVVQVGIADFANSVPYMQRAEDLGIRVVTVDEVRRRGVDDVVVEALAEAGAAGGPVHVDVDVDVCDRSVAPACPASVPGGLSAAELRTLVRGLVRDEHVRSVDIAEVDATADTPDGRTVRLAALCVLEVLAAVALREVA